MVGYKGICAMNSLHQRQSEVKSHLSNEMVLCLIICALETDAIITFVVHTPL